jgi:cation transport ATPase
MSISDIETAERLGRRRARVVPVFALVFMSGQAMYLGNAAEPLRAVDTVRIVAWLIWALALLLLLATGGGLFRSRAVRQLMEDETTKEHRRRGIAMGFWATMLSGVVLYLLAVFEDVTAREAIHIMLSFGIGTALVSFAYHERRAMRDG